MSRGPLLAKLRESHFWFGLEHDSVIGAAERRPCRGSLTPRVAGQTFAQTAPVWHRPVWTDGACSVWQSLSGLVRLRSWNSLLLCSNRDKWALWQMTTGYMFTKILVGRGNESNTNAAQRVQLKFRLLLCRHFAKKTDSLPHLTCTLHMPLKSDQMDFSITSAQAA